MEISLKRQSAATSAALEEQKHAEAGKINIFLSSGGFLQKKSKRSHVFLWSLTPLVL